MSFVDKLANEVPEIKEADRVVIVGYTACPHSHRALPKARKKKGGMFIHFDWGKLSQIKSKTGYTGTFPIVLVRNPGSGKLEHVGGATEYLAIAEG